MDKPNEQVRSKKKRKKPQIGRRCNEVHVDTTDAMASSLPSTISSESRNPYICPVILFYVGDQPQNEDYQVNHQSSHHFPARTTTEIPLATQQGTHIFLE